MKLLAAYKLKVNQWKQLYDITYNPELNRVLGVPSEVTLNPPTLVEFYENILNAYDDGTGLSWVILHRDKMIGYVSLVKTFGEWEMGIALEDKRLYNRRLLTVG